MMPVFEWVQRQKYANNEGSSRDLRIDFMRGAVMIILVVVHIEIFSVFNFLAWERIGVISGAEGFVILSGIVLGGVFRRSIDKKGFSTVIDRSLDRALQLYVVNIAIVLIIILIGKLFSSVDLHILRTFKNWGSGEVYILIPKDDNSWLNYFGRILLLRHSPQQLQILGLYCCLLLFTPIIVYFLHYKKAFLVMLLSCILYFVNYLHPSRPTGGQFEYAFPLLTWQLIYVLGLCYGFNSENIKSALPNWFRRLIVIVSVIITFGFIFFAWNSPSGAFPAWANLGFISPEKFNHWHWLFFEKNTLGILRLVNYFFFLITFYAVLTYLWSPVNKSFGWLLVPLGQASLYVFIMHLLVVLFADWFSDFYSVKPAYSNANLIINSIVHITAIIALWVMVKFKFLYKIVPR